MPDRFAANFDIGAKIKRKEKFICLIKEIITNNNRAVKNQFECCHRER